VAGLVGRQLWLALDDQNAQPGPAHEHLAGGRQAEDPAADDEEVGALDWRGGGGQVCNRVSHEASLSAEAGGLIAIGAVHPRTA